MKETTTRKMLSLNKNHIAKFLKKNYYALSKSKFDENFADPTYKQLQNKFYAIVNDEILLGLEFQKISPPLAVFHLQQSVEKLVKGWMLNYGFSYDQIRKPSHNTHKIFIELFKSNSPQICEIADAYGKKNVISQILQKLEKYNVSPSLNIAKISKNQIDFFLKKIDSIRVNNKTTPEQLEVWYDYLHDVFQDLPQNNFTIEKESLRKTLGPEFFTKFYNYQVSFIALFLLSYLTFSHNNWSRYPKDPSDSKQILEYDDYKNGLGIVDRTKELLVLCSQCKDDYSDFDIKEINESIAKLNIIFNKDT